MDDAQQKLMEFQMMHQQIQQLQQQMQMMEQQIIELGAVEESLQELQHVSEGTEILVPMSNGIFCKALLKNPKELLVNVGADTSVKKPVTSVIKMLKEQASEMQKVQEEMKNQLDKVTGKIGTIEKEMEALVKE